METEAREDLTISDLSASGEDSETQDISPEECEREAGLDEVIERAEGGSKDHFEVEEGTDNKDLAAPPLIDLLRDEPVPGVITRESMLTKKQAAPTDAGPLIAEWSRKKAAPEAFQF